jgi:hypothetical protein
MSVQVPYIPFLEQQETEEQWQAWGRELRELNAKLNKGKGVFCVQDIANHLCWAKWQEAKTIANVYRSEIKNYSEIDVFLKKIKLLP